MYSNGSDDERKSGCDIADTNDSRHQKIKDLRHYQMSEDQEVLMTRLYSVIPVSSRVFGGINISRRRCEGSNLDSR